MITDAIRTLDDGLVLRRARAADAEALATFHSELHALPDGSPDPGIEEWVLCLMTQPHPTFAPSDFLIVEDPATGEIASSLCLIDQTWNYGGVTVRVGRPELVATAQAYRRRGLVRDQMNVVHEWSRERQQQLQVIIGIPWYYRQFGYEMALDFDGGRTGYEHTVPTLKPGTDETYRFRPAVADDVEFIEEMVASGNKRYALACVRDRQAWLYEIETARGVNQRTLCVVESLGGVPVGVIAHTGRLYNGTLAATLAELVDGYAWHDVGPPLLRYLARIGRSLAASDDGDWKACALALGAEHPAYDALRSLLPRSYPPYAWYARVPDIAGFLDCVAPALDRRLARSAFSRFSGELHLNFYREGVRLRFEEGKLRGAEPWEPERGVENVAAFPDLTFLQLLLGRRSFEEIDAFFPDCGAGNDRSRELIQALFPKGVSNPWSLA